MIDIDSGVRMVNTELSRLLNYVGKPSAEYQRLKSYVESTFPENQVYINKRGVLQIRETGTAKETRYAMQTDFSSILQGASNMIDYQGNAMDVARKYLGDEKAGIKKIRKNKQLIHNRARHEYIKKNQTIGMYGGGLAGLDDIPNIQLREDLKDRLRSQRGKSKDERNNIYDEVERDYLNAVQNGSAFQTAKIRESDGVSISDTRFRR